MGRVLRHLTLLAAGTGAALAVVFAFAPVGKTAAAARELSGPAIAFLVLFSLAFNIVVNADRWRRALWHVGVKAPLATIVRIDVATGPVRLVMPMQTGEFVTAAALAQSIKAPVGLVAGTMIYNKYLALAATLILFAGGAAAAGVEARSSLVTFGGTGALSPIAAASAAAGAALLLFFSLEMAPARRIAVRAAETIHARFGDMARDLLAAFERIPFRAKLGLLAYSVIFQASEIVACAIIFRKLGIDVPTARLVAYVTLIVIVSSAPVFFAGIGAREGVALVLLAAYATPGEAVAAGFAYSFFEYLVPHAIGAPIAVPFIREALRSLRREDSSAGLRDATDETSVR
ncbi:flippase-like domain-containing protein [bacterium]|nr:flippase-like domain-containing protein [bacterium]